MGLAKFRRVIEAKWKCPYCPAEGKKWIKQIEARKSVRYHINMYHKEELDTNFKEAIIWKRKINEG